MSWGMTIPGAPGPSCGMASPGGGKASEPGAD